MLSVYYIFLILTVTVLNHFVKAGSLQKKLLTNLFENYSNIEIPISDNDNLIQIHLGLSIQQIIDIDEKKQIIYLNGWLDVSWIDYNLIWNPLDYGNINRLQIDSTKIWLPDILIYNSADDTFDPKTSVKVVINHDGTVNYRPFCVFKAVCSINLKDFPVDKQCCHLKLGSWTYDVTNLALIPKNKTQIKDLSLSNGEWDITKIEAENGSIKYSCCPTKYPFVTFKLNLKRRTFNILFSLILPCVLISSMCVLGFVLPCESGEKIGLESVTILTIIQFLQYFLKLVPENNFYVPKIAIYFYTIMGISAFSLVMSTFILVLHNRNNSLDITMPKWIEKWVCEYMAKWLLVKPIDNEGQNKHDEINLSNIMNILIRKISLDEHGLSIDVYDNNDLTANILVELVSMKRELNLKKWKFAAIVIDRFCIILFLFANVISTTFVFILQIKNLNQN